MDSNVEFKINEGMNCMNQCSLSQAKSSDSGEMSHGNQVEFRGNEEMSCRNRRALSQAVGVNLSALDLFSFIRSKDLDIDQEEVTSKRVLEEARDSMSPSLLQTGPRVEMSLPSFTHSVGKTSMRISALGPFTLDRCSVYIPIGKYISVY
jgi:hypothetical protein